MTFLRRLGFYTAFILPALVVAGYYLGGLWNWTAFVFSFILLPVIDYVIGLDTHNVSAEKVDVESNALYYRFVTYVWVFVQLIFVVWACYVVAGGFSLSIASWIGFVLGSGLVTGGIGITVAHELGHKPTALERFYCKVLLMTVCYMHFYIEHNRGHHVHVATPLDPATARRDESIYKFWFRSVTNSYAHAWALERDRLSKTGQSSFSLNNSMLWFTLLPLFFCGLLTLIFSLQMHHVVWQVPLYFFTQSIVAFSLLEIVNYVEHYGIQRKEIDNGRYERVTPIHSWNASYMVSNFFLFQLQRHSDHHAFAYKRYQVLIHHDSSPQLPFGYPTMIVISLLPPLWFGMMNKRLDARTPG